MNQNLSDSLLKLPQLKQISSLFVKQIFEARQLKNSSSSLSFDKNLLFKERVSGFNQKFLQVIYIGGSHIESALINPKKPKQILDFRSFEISSLKSTKEFLDLIASLYNPKADILNINLAAHLKSCYRNNHLDAVLVKNHRFHNLQDLVGKHIGLEVENYLLQIFNKKVLVSSCNNLVSLGFLAKEKRDFDYKNTIVGVVASGLNFGFYQDSETFINLESGKFKYQSKEISELFATNYLYKQFNKQAKKLGLALKLKQPQDFFKIVNNKQKYSLETYTLAKTLLQKSAQIVACQFYGIVLYKFGKKFILKENIKLLLEGSLFWDYKIYKQTFLQTLQELGLETEKIQIFRIKYGFIFGSSSSLYFESKIQKKNYLLIQKIYDILDTGINILRGPPARDLLGF